MAMTKLRALTVVCSTGHAVLVFMMLALIFAPSPRMRPEAVMIVDDDKPFLDCVDTGCWYTAAAAHHWDGLAKLLNADEAKLRRANVHLLGETVWTNDRIFVGKDMRANVPK